MAQQRHGMLETCLKPRGQDGRQTMMFSATFPREMQVGTADFSHVWCHSHKSISSGDSFEIPLWIYRQILQEGPMKNIVCQVISWNFVMTSTVLPASSSCSQQDLALDFLDPTYLWLAQKRLAQQLDATRSDVAPARWIGVGRVGEACDNVVGSLSDFTQRCWPGRFSTKLPGAAFPGCQHYSLTLRAVGSFFCLAASSASRPGFGWEVWNAGGCSEGGGDHEWWQSCKNSGLRQLKVRIPRYSWDTALRPAAFCGRQIGWLRKKLSHPTRFDGYGFVRSVYVPIIKTNNDNDNI